MVKLLEITEEWNAVIVFKKDEFETLVGYLDDYLACLDEANVANEECEKMFTDLEDIRDKAYPGEPDCVPDPEGGYRFL